MGELITFLISALSTVYSHTHGCLHANAPLTNTIAAMGVGMCMQHSNMVWL